MIAKNEHLQIRKMLPPDSDFRLFLGWMSDPENKKYWDGFSVQYTYEMVETHYWEQLEEKVQPCILEYDGAPIGYCQFSLQTAEEYEVPQADFDAFVRGASRVYAIDIFLGEPDFRDRGLGTQFMCLLLDTLFANYRADAVLIDPKTNNPRAIRCYEKAGFQKLFLVPQRETQDGIAYDSQIMGIRRPNI